MICGRTTKRSICDLPPELVGEEIFSRIPITSLREVRSTCKLWGALSREWVLGKAARQRQFVGFMTMDSKVCSMRFHIGKEEDLVDVSVNQVDLFNHVEISQVFHCEGLLLCVAEDNSSLLVWNPYLGQTRSILPRSSFYRRDTYALGYDKKNRTHKILRFVNNYDDGVYGLEIYAMSSDSWRVLDVTPDWTIESKHCASLKGDAYFFAREKIFCPPGETLWIEDIDDFLLCFDFTRERCGPRLPLPFHSYVEEVVALSCVGEKQLAVLYQQGEDPSDPLEIWVTTMIEPEAVSWMKFLKLDKRPVTCVGHLHFNFGAGSFFIDEEEKTAVVFDVDGYEPTDTSGNHPHHRAFIIGDGGYFKYVSLGEAPNVGGAKPGCVGYYFPPVYCPPLVCSSSYLPSFVQINQPPLALKANC